jgi:LPXTG-motif cell wall-anchored protein
MPAGACSTGGGGCVRLRAGDGRSRSRRLLGREARFVRRFFGVLVSVSALIVLLAPAAWAEGDYPPTPTAGPVDAVRAPGAAARQLPVTGADNTPSLVLIGVAALVIGLVLVLAVRRRRALARGIA